MSVKDIAVAGALLLVPPLVLRLAGRPLTGHWLGVPYNFTPPTPARLRRTLWNPSDDHVMAPHVYGWGYSVNLHALGRRLDLLHG